MRSEEGLLLEALRDPATVTQLDWKEWNALLQQGRHAGVLARMRSRLKDLDLLAQIPPKVAEILESAQTVANENKRAVLWELNRLERALSLNGLQVVLLKGAAYHMAELPLATGRLCADVDILVAKNRLGEVEQALTKQGWDAAKIDEYDQRYYRTWMHELPPLQHRDRHIEVDIHHALLPETSRLRTDSETLLRSAVALKETAFYVLAPVDMVLHSATHLFQDGFQGGDDDRALRDLTDIDEHLRHFGEKTDFWNNLVPRARHLGLQRPLFYALRYAQRILDTPVPDQVQSAVSREGPPGPVLAIMDALVTRALIAGHLPVSTGFTRLAKWVLYVRSHWLRMPPHLLAAHLARKSLTSLLARHKKDRDVDL